MILRCFQFIEAPFLIVSEKYRQQDAGGLTRSISSQLPMINEEENLAWLNDERLRCHGGAGVEESARSLRLGLKMVILITYLRDR